MNCSLEISNEASVWDGGGGGRMEVREGKRGVGGGQDDKKRGDGGLGSCEPLPKTPSTFLCSLSLPHSLLLSALLLMMSFLLSVICFWSS